MAAQTNVSFAQTAATSTNDYGLLRRALFVDGAGSGAAGILMALFPYQIEAFLGGKTPEVLFLIGVGFILFGAFALTTARSTPMNRTRAWIIVGINISYLLASVFILAANVFDLNTIGNLTILLMALVVVDLAFFEWLGLRRGSAKH